MLKKKTGAGLEVQSVGDNRTLGVVEDPTVVYERYLISSCDIVGQLLLIFY